MTTRTMTMDVRAALSRLGTLLMLLTVVILLAAPVVSAEEPPAQSDQPKYISPMHPWITSDEPGQCPICGMDMVPYNDFQSGSSGDNAITIDPVTVQNMGVRLAPVTRASLARSIRTVGVVNYAEPRQYSVNSKVDGWVERLYVNETGQAVTKGQPLLSLYSPELVSAQEDYLLALRGQQELAGSTLAGAGENAKRLLQAAETRLRYWDITRADIRRLQTTGEVRKNLTLTAPYSGVLTMRMVSEGMFVKGGMELFRVADISKVWVQADIYEYELPWVREGMPVEIELPYAGPRLKGKVELLLPFVEAKTRTVKARILLDNPGQALRPDMYVTVHLQGQTRDNVLTVPKEAVLYSGERQLVFVQREAGTFEPRNVQVGLQGSDGLVEIRGGLQEGEQVVTSAQFMLDSESQLREAIQKMRRAQKPAAAEPDAEDLFADDEPATAPAGGHAH